MAQLPDQTIHRDPQLFYWILVPITVVMVLTGILRHYASVLLATPSKIIDRPTMKEQRSLIHGQTVRNNHHVLSKKSFEARREVLINAYESGAYLKNGAGKDQAPTNPLTDPGAMDGMMGMMKNNMAMIIPNTLIMSWISAFFSGYVITKLPFPITIKFKSMLQAGVATKEMDPRWMSSISWYFLCIFGLQPVFVFLLGSDNAASQMAQQMGQMGPPPNQPMLGAGPDTNKQFLGEAENIAVIDHYSVLDDVELRLLKGIKG
ncbi:transmembrane protein [Sodiomyces alkalinus F11]|uniref:ER membrane protein complex subunit 3 n=1 Tax=Sodiomyces alkalinus (strain CBS 110278 / VKM F-3762 / F11) TaxID=1314773 RepID=A0A3N2PMF6_SODAK|nr:transmembrane protein [Sodiomyces alkalinus F11]ROT35594.1 transmembrane protein [Sodiomyces alkalinus F11]